jgi:hypothetical protein
MEEIMTNAERQRLYRERKKAKEENWIKAAEIGNLRISIKKSARLSHNPPNKWIEGLWKKLKENWEKHQKRKSLKKWHRHMNGRRRSGLLED